MSYSTVQTSPASVAREVLDRLETAWNTGDGAAFGAAYAPDASFVTIRGERFFGAATIAAGHAGIFGSIYAGSVNSMELVRAVEVAPDVVVSTAVSTLTCPTGPLEGVHQASSTSVLTRTGEGGWQVAATHNTLATT